MFSTVSRFHSAATASGLTLPSLPGGGVALPGPALLSTPAYQAVQASSRSLAKTAFNLRTGRSALGPFRVDSAASPADRDAQARGYALVWEHAQAAAFREGMPTSGARFDSLTANIADALTYWYNEVYETQYSELRAYNGDILRIDRRVPPFAETYITTEMDIVGVARVVNSYSMQDIPMVGPPVISHHTGRIIPAMVGFETNIFDAGRQALARANGGPNIDIARMKAAACDRALKEFANFLWLYGDSILGVDGLFNNPQIAAISLVGATWATKSAADILADLALIFNTIGNTSGGALGNKGRITVYLPPDAYNRISNLPVNATDSTSVLAAFLKNNTDLRADQVKMLYELDADNSKAYNEGPNLLASDIGLVVYNEGNDDDPMFVLPQDVEMPAPPRNNGLSTTTFYHLRAGGVKINDGRRIRYITGL